MQARLEERLLAESSTPQLFADLVGRDALLAMCTLDDFENEDEWKPVLRLLVKRAALIWDELEQALLAPDGPCRAYGRMAVAVLATTADERAVATLRAQG